MTIIIMVLLGIGLSISNVNGWFVVPEFCIWISFGIAVLLAIVSVFNYITAKNTFNKMTKGRRF